MHFVGLWVFEASPNGIPLGVVDIKLSKLLLINYYFTASRGEIICCQLTNNMPVRNDRSRQGQLFYNAVGLPACSAGLGSADNPIVPRQVISQKKMAQSMRRD